MTTLEDRYRRLLALYPAEHRRAFGDEMLGVLMSSAGEEQRRPRLGETADLMWHAVWRRLGAAMRPRGHGHWAMAVSVVGVVGSLSLFALHLRSAAGEQMWQLARGDTGWHGVVHWVLAGVAAVFALAVLSGPRWLVVPLAWAAVLAESGMRYEYPLEASILDDSYLVSTWTPLLLVLTTAVALSVPQPARGGLRLLGGRGVAALSVVALAAGLSVAADAALATVGHLDDGSLVITPMWGLPYMPLAAVVLAMVAGTVVLWRRLGGPVRRRVLIILAPSGGLYLLGLPLGFFVAYPDAWVSLSLIAGFVVLCFVALKGWERLMHLVELGRQAERAARENG